MILHVLLGPRSIGRAKLIPSSSPPPSLAWCLVSLRSTHPTVLLHRAVSRGYAPDGFYQAMRNDVPASSVAASRSTASTRACGGPCCSQVASASMASASPRQEERSVGKRVSVALDTGGRRMIKKKK